MPWPKNKSPTSSPSGNINEIITIGGSGDRNRSKHSRFERLDESVLRDKDLRAAHGAEPGIREDMESQDNSDEIPLGSIQKRMEVQQSKETR